MAPCSRGGDSTASISCTSFGMMMQVTRALGLGDAHRAVDEVTDLRRVRRHMDVFAGDVLEQRDQIDLLLVLAAERGARLLTDDGHHRLMIHLAS